MRASVSNGVVTGDLLEDCIVIVNNIFSELLDDIKQI
jgi:hypothetical protein